MRSGRSDGECDRMMKNVAEGWNRIVVSGSDTGAMEMDLAKFYVTQQLLEVTCDMGTG